MKKYVSILFIIMTVFLYSSCGKIEKEHKVMDAMMTWGYYSSYGEALNAADVVVVGKVVNIGETYRYDFELHPYEGKVTIRPAYYTPIEIEIGELIKGDYKGSTITYQALGGEIDNVIYDYTATDTLEVKVGEDILVFLKMTKQDLGYESISPGCVIIEDEKGIAKQGIKGQKSYQTIESMVDDIKRAKKAMEIKSKTK